MITSNRCDSVVATDFNAETQATLGGGGHDDAIGYANK
jgi:hypothetical protein